MGYHQRKLRCPLLASQFLLTIVVGMGAVTALASLLLALGYQHLPFRDPGRRVLIWEHGKSGSQLMAISGPDMSDFADATGSIFASFGPFTPPRLWLIDNKGPTEVGTCYIQARVFSDLGIRPVLGSRVRPDDESLADSATAPAWISYQLWQTRYGGSPSVIDSTIGLASSAAGLYEKRYRIVGVFPSGTSIPLPEMANATDVWYLLPQRVLNNRQRESDVFFGLGRLRPGATAAQAQAALTTVVERLERSYNFEWGRRPIVRSLEEIAQRPARQTMGLLEMGVGSVFLVGCVNLTILMVADGRRRRREIAIRVALGAERWRLWRDVAIEKCLLTFFSLALGATFSYALLGVLTQLVPAAGLGPPLLNPPPLNLIVLLGFSVFCFVAALAWSALLVAAADGRGPSATLRASGGMGYTGLSDSTPASRRSQLILLAAETGIGVCILAAGALAAKSYAALSSANLGPAPRHTLLLSVNPRDNVNGFTDAQSDDFNQQVLSRLQRLPGTRAVALADFFPPALFPLSFAKVGDPPGTTREATRPMSVSPGYFRTLGIPIFFGRGFNETDRIGSEPVAIISLDMAQGNWDSPTQAVGAEIVFGPKSRYKIVGIAANFTGYWDRNPIPTVYLPAAQGYCCSAVILRTDASVSTVAGLAPQALAGMTIPATISNVSTMRARWQEALTRTAGAHGRHVSFGVAGIGADCSGRVRSGRGNYLITSARACGAVSAGCFAEPAGLDFNP